MPVLHCLSPIAVPTPKPAPLLQLGRLIWLTSSLPLGLDVVGAFAGGLRAGNFIGIARDQLAWLLMPAENREAGGPPGHDADMPPVYDADETSVLTGEVHLNDNLYIAVFKSCVEEIGAYEAQHGAGVFDEMFPEYHPQLRYILAKSVCMLAPLCRHPCRPKLALPPSLQLTPFLPAIARNVGLKSVKRHVMRGAQQLLTLHLHDDGGDNNPEAFVNQSIRPLSNCIFDGSRPAFAPVEDGAGWQWNVPAAQQQGHQPGPLRVTGAQKRCLEATYALLRACLGLHGHEGTSLGGTDEDSRTWVQKNPRRIFALYFLLERVLAPEYNQYLQVGKGTCFAPDACREPASLPSPSQARVVASYPTTVGPELDKLRTRLDDSEAWLQHMLQLAYMHGSEQAKHAHERASRLHDLARTEMGQARNQYNQGDYADAAAGLHRARHFCSLAENAMRADLGIHRQRGVLEGSDRGVAMPAVGPGTEQTLLQERNRKRRWTRTQKRRERGELPHRGGRKRAVDEPPPMQMPTCKVPTLFPYSHSGRALHVWIDNSLFKAATNHARINDDNTVQWDGQRRGFSLRDIIKFHANNRDMPKCVQSYRYYKWSGMLVTDGYAASWTLRPQKNAKEELDKRFRNPGQELKLLYDKLLSDLHGEGTYPKKRRKVQRYLANLRAREREALILSATHPDRLGLVTGLRDIIRAISELPVIGGPGEISEDGASDEMSVGGGPDEVSVDHGQVPDDGVGPQALENVEHALQNAVNWLEQKIPHRNVPAVGCQIPYLRRGIYHPADDLVSIAREVSSAAKSMTFAIRTGQAFGTERDWWACCHEALGLFPSGELMDGLRAKTDERRVWYDNRPHLRAAVECTDVILELARRVEAEVSRDLTYAPPGTLGPVVVVGIDPGNKVLEMAVLQVVDRTFAPGEAPAGDGGPLYQEDPVMRRDRTLALTLPYRREKSGQAMQERSGRREAREVARSIRHLEGRPNGARGSPGTGGQQRGSAEDILNYAMDISICWPSCQEWRSIGHRQRNFSTYRARHSVMDRFSAEVG